MTESMLTARQARQRNTYRISLMRSFMTLLLVTAWAIPSQSLCAAEQTATEQTTTHQAADVTADRDETQTVAGRTVEQYAELVSSEDRVVRLRAVKSLGAFGKTAGEVLKTALTHDDRAVAYIAAMHLGRIGGQPLKSAIEPLTELAENKDSLALRMAGAFALCRAGQLDQRLSVLTNAITYPDRGTACSAAELIGMIGPDAKAAIEVLEKARADNDPAKRNGDYHVGGAAGNALRKIRGE